MYLIFMLRSAELKKRPGRKSSTFGITIPQEALGELKNASSPELSIVKGVRQAFYIATAISPLLMLVPKKYHALRQTIRKDALVAVSKKYRHHSSTDLVTKTTVQHVPWQ